jgi:hypothetical protein
MPDFFNRPRSLVWLMLGWWASPIATLQAAEYFVAPDGLDSAAGTLSAPFGSVTRAQRAANRGDTVYLRGGTYKKFAVADSDSVYRYVHDLSKNEIRYCAYQNEVPVFDFSQLPTTKRVCGFHITGHGIVIVGVQVTGVPVGEQKQSECFRIDGVGASCAFDRCVCHDNAANGFYYTRHASGSCVNCDSYNNVGVGPSIGNTDGFGAHGDGVVFRFCRAWHNSDDGFDCIASYAANTFDHCWAYDMTAGGDSNGFKIGGWGRTPVPDKVPVHTVRFCLVAGVNAHGLYANHQPGQSANWTNNTSYNNRQGNVDLLERVSPSDSHDIPGTREVIHYTLSFGGLIVVASNLPAANETDNSWTRPGTAFSADDFESLDASQMTRPRKPDGSLPDITFMHLKKGHTTDLGCFPTASAP